MGHLRKSLLVVMVMLVFAAVEPPARAQDYYKDKTLTIIVGYSPGGSFDLYARVLGRYIGRYLPRQSDSHRREYDRRGRDYRR